MIDNDHNKDTIAMIQEQSGRVARKLFDAMASARMSKIDVYYRDAWRTLHARTLDSLDALTIDDDEENLLVPDPATWAFDEIELFIGLAPRAFGAIQERIDALAEAAQKAATDIKC